MSHYCVRYFFKQIPSLNSFNQPTVRSIFHPVRTPPSQLLLAQPAMLALSGTTLPVSTQENQNIRSILCSPFARYSSSEAVVLYPSRSVHLSLLLRSYVLCGFILLVYNYLVCGAAAPLRNQSPVLCYRESSC